MANIMKVSAAVFQGASNSIPLTDYQSISASMFVLEGHLCSAVTTAVSLLQENSEISKQFIDSILEFVSLILLPIEKYKKLENIVETLKTGYSTMNIKSLSEFWKEIIKIPSISYLNNSSQFETPRCNISRSCVTF
eukprot:TRINITY_DN9458_c0_g1_i6.p1 TRINITY_DN9458_c0_g1~~TRINITY_DN9458_c0_g1_i6.p1  ORF type:complete len:136 (+),score=25.35 TRINITY_DN9458_c0_g1_i6:403-810(+)